MQSANMFSDEQIPNGVQRSPLDALDKAISTADTSFTLLETLREPEEIREVHVSSPVEMKIPESQGSSTEKAASSTVGPITPIDLFWLRVDEWAIRTILRKFLRVKHVWVAKLPQHRNGGVVRWVSGPVEPPYAKMGLT
jgi:hypothetical protein